MFTPPIDPHKPPNLPKTAQQRHAEETDTRQAIRHHENPTYERKQHDQNPQSGLFDTSQGPMVLGVVALIEFLQNFITEQRRQHGVSGGEGDGVGAPSHPVPPSPAASQAVHAYTHASHTRTPVVDAGAVSGAGEESSDIRRARALLGKLRGLAMRGVQGIAFTPRANFLDALEAAILQAENNDRS